MVASMSKSCSDFCSTEASGILLQQMAPTSPGQAGRKSSSLKTLNQRIVQTLADYGTDCARECSVSNCNRTIIRTALAAEARASPKDRPRTKWSVLWVQIRDF